MNRFLAIAFALSLLGSNLGRGQERDLDAAFCVGEKAYFLKHQFLIRFDTAANRADPEFPKKISEVWPEFPWSRVEAARELEGTVVRFFRGTECLDFDIAAGKSVKGPFPLAEVTTHFSKVQAAITGAPTGIFFGDRVLSPMLRGGREPYILGGRGNVVNSPHPPFWGFWYEKNLDAAVMFPDRRTFFFKGDRVTFMANPFKRVEYVGGKRQPIYTVEAIDEIRFPGLRFGLCGEWRNSYGERIEVYQRGKEIEVSMRSASGLRRWTGGSGIVHERTVTLQRTGPFGDLDKVGKMGTIGPGWDVVDWGDGNTWRRIPWEFSGLWRDEDDRFVLVEGPLRAGATSNQFVFQAVALDSKVPWNTGTGILEIAESDVGVLEMVFLGANGKSYRDGYYKSNQQIDWEEIGSWRKWDEQGELWRDSVSGEFVWLILDGGEFAAQMLDSDRVGTARFDQEERRAVWEFSGQGGPPETKESFLTDDARIVWQDGSYWYRMRSFGVRWKSRAATPGIISVIISGERGLTDKFYLNDFLTGERGAVAFRKNRLNSATILAPDIGDFDKLVFGLDRDATAARFGSVPANLEGALSDIRLYHEGGTEEWDAPFALVADSVALESVTPARRDPAPPLPVELTADGKGIQSVEIVQDGKKTRYLLYPDNHDPFLWYYVPQDLQLVERSIRGQRWPELSFLRYQKVVSGAGAPRLERGAELSFAVQIEAGDRAVTDQLKAGLLGRSATLRYLTGTSPWAYVADWKGSFQLNGFAWEPRYVREDPVLGRLGDFRNAFEISRGARSGLQEQRALRALELLPLPVTSTQVRLNPVAGEAPVQSDRVELRNAEALSVRGLRKFREARFFADLGPSAAGDELSRNATLVQNLLQGPTGVLASATLGFQRMQRAEAYRAAVFDLDPGQVVSDWMEALAARLRNEEGAVTETEMRLLRVLEEEWYTALDLGYRPADQREATQWAKLLDQANEVDPIPDSFDFETFYRDRYLSFAVYYLLWIAMDSGSREASALEGSPRREAVKSYLSVRREAGPNFLNFMSWPDYRSEYRNDSNGDPILRPHHSPGKDSGDGAVEVDSLSEEVVRLFEGRNGKAEISAEVQLQEPLQVELPETLLGLQRYDDEVADALFAFRSEPVRPGAVVLPDPDEDDWLGIGSLEISPSLEFAAESGQLIGDALAANLALGTGPSPEAALSPVEVVSGKNRNSIVFPTLRWTKPSGWEGRRTALTEFLLPGIDQELEELLVTNAAFLDASYRVRYTVTHPNGGITFDELIPVFSGTVALPFLGERLDVLRVTFDGIDWEGGVERVSVKLKQGEREFRQEFQAEFDAGKPVPPSELAWLVSTEAGPAEVEVHFLDANSSRAWSGNGFFEEFSTLHLQ